MMINEGSAPTTEPTNGALPPGTRILEYVCAGLMAVLAVVLFVQVFGRYALNDPPVWTEELARTLFLYATFIGGALALARQAHLRIDAAVKMLPPAAQMWTQVLTHLVAIVFLGFVVFQSSVMLPRLSFQPLTALPFLSKAWFFAAVPVGCGLMLLYELFHFWRFVSQMRRPADRSRG